MLYIFIVSKLYELGLSYNTINTIFSSIYNIVILFLYLYLLSSIIGLMTGATENKINYYLGIKTDKTSKWLIGILFFVMAFSWIISINAKEVIYMIDSKSSFKDNYSAQIDKTILQDTAITKFFEHKDEKETVTYLGKSTSTDEYYFELNDIVYRTTNIEFKDVDKNEISFKQFTGKENMGFKDINFKVYDKITVRKSEKKQTTYSRPNTKYISEDYAKVKFNK